MQYSRYRQASTTILSANIRTGTLCTRCRVSKTARAATDMTSIIFPQTTQGFAQTSDASSHQSAFFPTTYDPASSFQMNPLSSHPPRTPRTSLLSSSTYGTDLHGSVEEQEEKPVHVQPEESMHHEESPKESTSRVQREEVWREIVKTSVGRDKALVCAVSWTFMMLFLA